MDVLLVAAPKNLIDKYVKILNNCDIDVVAMETEIISASRALLPPTNNKPMTVMVINLGAKTIDLSILRKGVIAFTRSIPTGGESFTKALVQDFGFSQVQAEEYKKTYGLEKDKLEGKVYRSLKPLFTVFSEEIKRAITYFQNKFPDDTITTIILSGGTARLPGLVEAIVEDAGVETQIGNPWLNIEKDEKIFAKLEDEGALFSVAIGLAMRE
jgi:type IV pilus assembly protein PilM